METFHLRNCTLLDGRSTDLNLIVSTERAQSMSRSAALTDEQVIQTAGWSEVFVCCLSGSMRLTNTVGDVEKLHAVDVARCAPADGDLVSRKGDDGLPSLVILDDQLHLSPGAGTRRYRVMIAVVEDNLKAPLRTVVRQSVGVLNCLQVARSAGRRRCDVGWGAIAQIDFVV